MSTRTTFYWSRRKAGWICAGVLLAAAFGVSMILEGDSAAQVLGVGWIVAFLALASALARRVRSSEPVLTIDANGLFDRRVFEAPIPWIEIGRVELIEAEHMTFIGVELTDQALSRAHRMVRWMKWPNRLFGMPPFSIAMHALDGTVGEAMAAIERFKRP